MGQSLTFQFCSGLGPCRHVLHDPAHRTDMTNFEFYHVKNKSHLSYHHTGLTYTLALTDITLRVVWRGSVPVEQQWSTWFWNSLTARINWDPPSSHYTSVARGTLHPSWLVIACYLQQTDKRNEGEDEAEKWDEGRRKETMEKKSNTRDRFARIHLIEAWQ